MHGRTMREELVLARFDPKLIKNYEKRVGIVGVAFCCWSNKTGSWCSSKCRHYKKYFAAVIRWDGKAVEKLETGYEEKGKADKYKYACWYGW